MTVSRISLIMNMSYSAASLSKRLAGAVVLAVLAAISSFAHQKAMQISPRTTAKINKYLDGIGKQGFSGVVMVESNGHVVVSRAFGMRNAEKNIPNDVNSVMDIGSLTKQFTAAAILKLEMQGKLSTDDKIAKYFDNVAGDKAEITIHHLLRHLSGLTGDVGGDYENITREDFLVKLMASPLESRPGEQFGYSNIGYSLLAMIIEKLSGRSYENFLYESLFHPAGMESTGYSRPKFDPNSMAVGYRWDGQVWGKPTDKQWDGDAPFWHLKGNGGILTTASDMAKWAIALRGDTVLSPAAKQKMHATKLRPDENENPFYGYGWDIFRTGRNTLVATHNGTNNIFYAEMHRFLDEKLTIFHMVNKGIPSFVDVNRQITRIIFEPAYVPTVPPAENAENQFFTDEIIKIVLEKGVGPAVNAFNRRKPGLGLIRRFINRKGYDLLREKKFEQAIEMFRLNTIVFPRSSNVFDSLGEGYMEAGDKKLALKNFEKSLQLDPENGNAAQMIKNLREKPE